MQTLSDLALEIVSWRRMDLSHGAYSVSEVRVLACSGEISDLYTERIDAAQFADSLTCVKTALGLTGGVWVGMERDHGDYIEVLAIRLE